MATWSQINRTVVKGLLLGMNGLCMLLALSTLGFSIVDLRILKQYGEKQAAGTAAGDIIIMTASLLLIAVAVIGCVGVIKMNLKCLYMYVGLLMILVVLEMMIAIFVALQRYGLQFRITEWIREDFFRNITTENRVFHERTWDDLQMNYQCCGLNGPADYTAIQQPVSLSCCPRAYRARTAFAQQQLYRLCIEHAGYYQDGCEDEILDILRSDADWLLGAAISSFWVEVLDGFNIMCDNTVVRMMLKGAGMLLASWLANNIKNSVTVYKDTVRY